MPAAASLAGCAGSDQEAHDQETYGVDAMASSGSMDVPIGVQLYSVRNELDADLEGTLRGVKAAGFDEVETYSLHDLSVTEYRALLDEVGLTVKSMHAPYERVASDIGAVAEDAHALGSPWVAVAWIPHEAPFGVEDIDRAIADFTAAGQALQGEGLRFAYHCHGYEFREMEGGGTLFDRFMEATEPGVVDVEMDIFWVRWPGHDPVALIEKYPGRFPLYHMKDMRIGTELGDLSGHAPLEANVPIGQGMIDFPAIMRAAEAAGVERYFIEYEYTDAMEAIRLGREHLMSIDV